MNSEKRKKIQKYIEDPKFAIYEQMTELVDKLSPYVSLFKNIDRLKGEKGDKGDDGYTPKVGKDYFTQDDAEVLLDELLKRTKGIIKGTKGDRGDMGPAGRTPIKGVDYFTDDEVSKIIKKITSLARPVKNIDYFDGARGIPGIDGKNGKDGKSVSLDDILKELKKSRKLGIEDLYNFPRGGPMSDLRYHGGGNVLQDPLDISSQLNGVKKSFTITGALSTSKIVGVYGSSAPFIFRPLIDYTWSSPTLTFTASVDAAVALAANQSLVVQFTK